MNSKSIRSLLFSASVFVFLCLLISGRSRLIGHADGFEEASLPRILRCVPAQLTAGPAPAAEDVCPQPNRQLMSKKEYSLPFSLYELPVCVMCDANGNVLSHRSYIHEVYYVFSLGDGFV